jgi:hypothetical protein
MQQLTLLVVAATWWSLSLASFAKATSKGNSVNGQDARTYGEIADEQMNLDYSQQPMQATYQQPAYDPSQGFYPQPVQAVEWQPAQGEKFLATNPVQGVASSPVQVASGQQSPPDLTATSNPTGGSGDAAAVAASPVQVASGQQSPPDLTVTIKPTDRSGDEIAGAGSHLQHETTFSLCDIIPPPWNIVCMIIELIFFTWPMYYFWLGLIALGILYCIYLQFKTILDPIIIAILDCIYIIVKTVVTICKAIWWCIKKISYPIKECILKCQDTVDTYMNPYKSRRPHTHVPGFSY